MDTTPVPSTAQNGSGPQAPPAPVPVQEAELSAPAPVEDYQPMKDQIPGHERIDEIVGKAIGGTVIPTDIKPSDMPTIDKIDAEKAEKPAEQQPQQQAEPTSTATAKKETASKEAGKETAAPKKTTVGAYPEVTRIGWLEAYKRTDGAQNEFRDKSIWMDEFASSALYGAFWHNASAVVVIPVVCFIVFKLGGGFVSLILIIAFGATYYKNSIRRFRRNARDDITRELIRNSLENDAESTEWINNFMAKFWLIYEPVLSATVVQVVDGILVDQTPAFLDSIRLTTFTLGTKAPRVESVKTFPKTDPDVVLMDWRVAFTPTDTEDMTPKDLRAQINPKICLTIRVGKGIIGAGMPILVEDMSFKGYMRIKLKLTSNFPHIKTLDFCFLEPPTIDYALKPVGGETFGMDIAHIPGLQSFIRDQTHAILGPMMYDPNVYTLDLEQMMTGGASLTAAVGVVQFTIYDAKDLKNSELVGNSDPYIKLRLGNRPDLAVTEVKNDTLNPVWNETNIILVNNLNEVVCMEIMDKDNLRKDRPLGQANFDLKSLEEDPIQDDVWCKVLRNGKERGAVRIRAAYFPVQQPKALEEGGELVPIESNSGILAINLAQAKDIARSGKTKSLCQISLNGRIIHTTRKMLGANPAWGADVDAFITDLAGSQFLVEVVSEGSVIGSYNVSGTQLLKDTADKTEWASLKGSEGTGKLKMTGIWKPILMGEDMNPVAHKPAFGVMRVQVVAGRDLRNVEIGGSSDPYVVIVGDKGVSRGCTKTIDSNLNPVWDEIFYVSVNSMRQVLEFETFDFQKMTKDRSLGKTSFKVSEVIEELPDKAGYKARPTFDRWEPLKQKDGSTKGDLHLVISFFPSHKLAQEATADAQAGVAPITAPLPEGTIYASRALDYDSGILVAHLTTGELDRSGTYCEFYVDSDTYQYKSQMQKSRTPKWNEVADLFVKELEYAKLTILVKEKSAMDKDLIVGTFSSNIRSLMETTPVEGGSFVVLDGASKRGSLQLRFEYFPVPIELLPKERLDNMGNMTVTLVRAKNLAAADRGGSSDPYVVFRVNDKEVFKSDVVKKSLDPDFNETFVTPIASRAEDIFTFEVFDWNQIAAAKSLGVGSLDLRSLQLVLPNTFDIPLKGKFNQGNVYLRVKFVPEFLSSNKRKSGFGATFLGGGVNLVGQAGAAGVGAMAGGVGAVGKGALNVTGAVGKGALDVTGAVGKGALDVTGAVGKGALDVTGAVGKGALKGVGAVGKGVFGGLAAGASAVGLNRRSDSTSQSKGSPPQSQGANVEQSITSMGPGQIVTEEEVLVLDRTLPTSSSSSSISRAPTVVGSAQSGSVTINVVEADGLMGVDRGGMSDPYVKVRLGDQTVLKTKVKKETLSPVWNESVVIPGNTSQPLRLVFSVKDHNKIGSDVDLGDCELDLWNYIQPGQGQNRSDFWATLAGSGGRLRLALEFEAGGSASSPVESRRSGLLSRK